MNSPERKIPTEGLNPKIKMMVIVLTVITIIAFSALFIKLVTRMASPSSGKNWASQLELVGDELNKAGLKEQAIEQYTKFLQQGKVDLATRARVSQTLGELYAGQGNCAEGLVWFYQARIAGPEPSRKDSLQSQISSCLREVQAKGP